MRSLPTKLNFDICTLCNHSCYFCSNEDTRALKASTSYEDFVRVMDNVTQYMQISELGLSAKGEVTLNKDLVSIVRAAKERYGIGYVYISTNGSLLNEKLLIDVLDAGLDSIKFSINGYDAKSYLHAHKKDDFIKVVENFNTLLELKANRYKNIKILISAITDMPIEQFKKKLRGYFKNFDLINDILHYTITYTSKFEKNGDDESRLRLCPLVFNEVYIDADCRLALCCKDYFKEFDFGSLLKNDFKELYFSKPMEEIRLMHQNIAFPKDHTCRKCLLFSPKEIDD